MKKEISTNQITYEEHDEFVGKIVFDRDDHYIYANSTAVDTKHRGKGIARKLVLDLIELAKKENKQIVPVCSYVVDFANKNSEFQEIFNTDQ